MLKNFLYCINILGICMLCACAKPQAEPQIIPVAKDIKRLELYNNLDNLKEGIWKVEEWKKFAKKICDNSKEKDCSVLAEIYHDYFYGYGSKSDRQQAMQILEKSCTLEDSKSCLQLAIYGTQSNQPIKVTNNLFAKAHNLALEQCNKDYAMDCYVLSLIYFEGYGGIERDRGKAKGYALKACDMKHAGSCRFLGINADTREEAQEVYTKACVLGVKEFCK
ncbi:sel1 repeat family protein [Helicobacter didelphidarum]|uniref:Beta-lactamase n=1 Tax=Helicobacter didelphidarum TaxID=2040648 RepID=A0A3D8IAN6_9HELI|nr:sel1 repeat family protein [Helicobacter didelphidarum]RDU62233.1 sel1 repeat family protein [Helicobacter didelphidarum]